MPVSEILKSKKSKGTIRAQAGVILVMAAAIISIVYFHYSYSRNALLEECGGLIRESMGQINATIEMTLDNVMDISKQPYNDTALHLLMRGGENSLNFDSYNYIMRKLDQIRNSNRNIDSLAFYLENESRVIYQHYGATQVSNLTDEIFLQWYESQPCEDISIADTHPVALGSYSKNVMSVFARLPMGKGAAADGALIINIDQGFIYSNIAGLSQNGILFHIADEYGKIIFSKNESLLYRNIDEISYLKDVSPNDAVHKIVKIDGSPCLVAASLSSDRNWQYIMAYPISKVYATISNIRTMVAAISLAVLLLSSGIIFLLLSSTFYKYDEVFALIKSKIGAYKAAPAESIKEDVLKLFSDRDSMQEKWDAALPIFKDKFYLGLIMQKHSRAAILEQAQRYGIHVPTDNLILSVVEMTKTPPASGICDEYIESVSTAGIIESALSDFEGSYFTVDVMNKRLVLVSEIQIEELLLRLDRIIRLIVQRLGISVSIGVLNAPCSVENLNDSYLKALQVIPYRIVFGSNRIILYSDIDTMPEAYTYPAQKDESLRILIKSGNREKSLAVLSDMLEEMRVRHSYFTIQQFIFRLNASLMELMDRIPSASRAALAQIDLQSLDSLDKVQMHFEGLMNLIIDHMEKRSESKTDQYFNQISTFIAKNYSKDLSVEEVCSFVKLSPTYVNQILKKYSGKSFVQYLNDFRIELSCSMLLEDPSAKIMDISERLGFNSSKYFIKLFKDIKGVTPGEYRKQR